MAPGSIPARDIFWLSTTVASTALTSTTPTASPNSTSPVTTATGLRITAPTPLLPSCPLAAATARTLLTGNGSYKRSAAPRGRAKKRSDVRRNPTKNRRTSLTLRTETWTTPRGYCALKEPGVTWCDKGFHDSSNPRITLRVGKLTSGDGSYGRVGSP
ncbi:hypothetical protein GCM10010447_26100 [Streptomyces fulvorobeus]